MKKIKNFFNREQNLLIHIIATIVVTFLGIIFKIHIIEWVMVYFAVFLVITSELLNSSIELTVDLYTKEFNPLAMVAKDTSAGAVTISALIALIIGIYVFLPRIICMF